MSFVGTKTLDPAGVLLAVDGLQPGGQQQIEDMVDRLVSLTVSAHATGVITCATKANLVDTDYITLGDGIAVAVRYSMDTAGNGGTGVAVNVSGATTAASVAALLRTAILANQPAFSVVDNADGTLSLTHNFPGTGGNVTITENVAHASFTVTGMAGGLG